MKNKIKTDDMAKIAMAAALMCPCAWLSIPTVPPFTMQTFGAFLTLLLLGGKRGTLSLTVYLLLGALGLPVFSSFNGGIGALIGPTGGYLVGFVMTGLCYWLITRMFGNGMKSRVAGLASGLAVCYAFGTAWFVLVYGRTAGSIGFAAAASKCVLPFVVPDAAKLALSLWAAKVIQNKHSI